jgi:hypothetical protein
MSLEAPVTMATVSVRPVIRIEEMEIENREYRCRIPNAGGCGADSWKMRGRGKDPDGALVPVTDLDKIDLPLCPAKDAPVPSRRCRLACGREIGMTWK